MGDGRLARTRTTTSPSRIAVIVPPPRERCGGREWTTPMSFVVPISEPARGSQRAPLLSKGPARTRVHSPSASLRPSRSFSHARAPAVTRGAHPLTRAVACDRRRAPCAGNHPASRLDELGRLAQRRAMLPTRGPRDSGDVEGTWACLEGDRGPIDRRLQLTIRCFQRWAPRLIRLGARHVAFPPDVSRSACTSERRFGEAASSPGALSSPGAPSAVPLALRSARAFRWIHRRSEVHRLGPLASSRRSRVEPVGLGLLGRASCSVPAP